MNGAHDLGGTHGLGPINPEAEQDEPIFHHDWEKRALGLTLAAGFLGQWNIDISRHARERQHPVDYLSNSYYENWLTGLETLLLETGMVSEAELKSGQMENPAKSDVKDRCVAPQDVGEILAKGGPSEMETDQVQYFQVGDRVRVKISNPTGHTRAPRYIRGQVGIIKEYFGSHVFPDESSKGNRVGAHLYNVAFEGKNIWGSDQDTMIHVDLWQDYLEAV